ncbi:MAG TPA: YlxR family protein [Fimbriimonadales bacterium]|nr:YlxR family protein [Fimbriimonadales bacterium]
MPHVPIRTCVACKAKRSKLELLRIGKTKAGEVKVGESEGRGVYLCPSSECIEKAIRKRVIVYPLRLGNSSVDWKRLESELMKALSENSNKERT